MMRRPTTMKDLAGALGMHKSTVSLALSGKGTISPETRQRVLDAARALGYEPNLLAQRLAHGQGSAAVCIFSGVLDVGLATEKILLVQKELNGRASLDVPIYTCYDTPGDEGEAQAAQVRQLCRQRPRAVLCAAQRVHTAVFQELQTFQNGGGIVVSYDTRVPLTCDQVIFDREDNAYRAARHLLEQGHRKIGLAMSAVHAGATTAATAGSTTNGSDGGANGMNGARSGGHLIDGRGDPQSQRLAGFQRALKEFGLPWREDWFFRTTTYEKGGKALARQFLSLQDRPTGLCIVNDYVALALMVELTRAGVRIPEDLSLIGHDNQPIAEYCPVPLTSMTQPVDRIARAVVDLLLERLENDPLSADAPERTVLITGDLVLRESVGPPRR